MWAVFFFFLLTCALTVGDDKVLTSPRQQRGSGGTGSTSFRCTSATKPWGSLWETDMSLKLPVTEH